MLTNTDSISQVHWLTSPGLGGGRYDHHIHSALPDGFIRAHNPPLVFNVEHDPSEMLPVALSNVTLAHFERLKSDYEAQLKPTAIDPRFGFQWALCCGVGCTAPCDKCQCKNKPLPQPDKHRAVRIES